MTRFRHPGRFGAAYPPLRPALLSAALLAANTAQAARPMITDDARIVDAKNGWGVGLAACTVRHPQTDTRDWYAYVPSSFSFRDDAVPLILLAYMGLTQAMKGFVVRRYGWQ